MVRIRTRTRVRVRVGIRVKITVIGEVRPDCAASNMAETSVCPAELASCWGVFSSQLNCLGLGLVTSRIQSLLAATIWHGVVRRQLRCLISNRPSFRSTRTTIVCPYMAAICSEVCPMSNADSGLAPYSQAEDEAHDHRGDEGGEGYARGTIASTAARLIMSTSPLASWTYHIPPHTHTPLPAVLPGSSCRPLTLTLTLTIASSAARLIMSTFPLASWTYHISPPTHTPLPAVLPGSSCRPPRQQPTGRSRGPRNRGRVRGTD